MSSRKATVVILCEGVEDYNFARRALTAMGWKKRSFEPRVCSGGSGEQFVREAYAAEVAEQRARRNRKLLVITDADVRLSVAARANSLARSLKDAGGAPRGRNEAITHWIPKRHLETWVFVFARGAVDEETDYKSKVNEADHASAARRWGADLKRRSIAPRQCPSLDAALAETERIRS